MAAYPGALPQEQPSEVRAPTIHRRASASLSAILANRSAIRGALGYEGSLWKTGRLNICCSAAASGFSLNPARDVVFGLVETGARPTTDIGLLFDLRIGVGYLNIAWDETTQHPQPSLSTSHFMPSALLGIGYDFRRVSRAPLAFWSVPA